MALRRHGGGPPPLRASAGQRRAARAARSVWLGALLLVAAAGLVPQPSAATQPKPGGARVIGGGLVQGSVPARFCPGGGTLEGGLCYARCKLGWSGLGCTCWRGLQTYSRGCGTKPLVCHTRSYRSQRLAPVGDGRPFSLVLSADPQLFRVVNHYKNTKLAMAYNQRLVTSINKVTQLRSWPWEAGGGAVQPPRSLVMLGDMTEFYREDELDAFRHLYDPAFPRAAPPAAAAAAPAPTAAADASGGGGGGDGVAAHLEAGSRSLLAGDDGQQQQQQQPPQQQQQVADHVTLPTWFMFGNHDYVNNVNDCGGQFKALGRNSCAQTAVDTMRAVLTPGCDDTTWSGFPRANVTSFDADSMAYSFDEGAWHFVVLQYSPRYSEPALAVRSSMGWLASELSSATAQGRHIVLLVHAHRELGLVLDPTFSRLVSSSNVAAIFYGHVHIKPWGMTGNFPNTNVPMFNCGASWYHVYCYAEFGQDRRVRRGQGSRVVAQGPGCLPPCSGVCGGRLVVRRGPSAGRCRVRRFRVAAIAHNGSSDAAEPRWFGTSVHALLKQQRGKPVLQQFSQNPNSTLVSSAAPPARTAGGPLLLLLASLALWLLGL